MSEDDTLIAMPLPGSITHDFENTTPFEIMKQLTGSYACREVRPGVFEHTFTPAEAAPFYTYIDDNTVAITYRGSIPVHVAAQRRRKEIAAKQRKRRQHRAVFRRRKRGLQ